MTSGINIGSTRQYMEFMAKIQEDNGAPFSPMRWLLDNGIEAGDWSPLPSRMRRRPVKQCFHNSLAIALRNTRRFAYMEGYASNLIPVEHAWCIDRVTGLVVDATWKEGTQYIGVAVKPEYALRCLRKERSAVMNWQEHFPIMTGAVATGEWRDEWMEARR